jgi:hypothetical protein
MIGYSVFVTVSFKLLRHSPILAYDGSRPDDPICRTIACSRYGMVRKTTSTMTYSRHRAGLNDPTNISFTVNENYMTYAIDEQRLVSSKHKKT